MVEIKDLGTAIRVDSTFLQKCNVRMYIIGDKVSIWHNDHPILAEITYTKVKFDGVIPTDLDDLYTKVEALIQG